MKTNPLVVDLYHGDRVTDFAEIKAGGIVGVIHKAQQGASAQGSDPTYQIRRRSAAAADLLWGAYHFMTSDDPQMQAEAFVDAAAPDARTLLAIDFEPYGNRTPSLNQLRAFLEALYRLIGRKAVIYSGSLLKETLGAAADPFLASHQLWLAEYGPQWKLGPLTAWQKPWLWQYSETGKVAGVAGNVDLNSYDGTPAQLAAEWASPVDPTVD